MSQKEVEFLYTNWRGEIARRRVLPVNMWFGKTEWHPDAQWLLRAHDIEKGVPRDFAMKDILEWNEAPK